MLSYDGRNQEPVTLPVKFPLLLAQGVEGIAVGLASKNPAAQLQRTHRRLRSLSTRRTVHALSRLPDGGLIDVSRYNDGLRGGVVKVRARISKIDKRTLAITEIPYGTTTESIKESIIKANEKGKIKIRKVDDNTAEKVEIIVHVSADESADKTIDALYAFTDCEVSISPNSCVISDEKPHFIGVSEILRRSAERTKHLLGTELRIRLGELDEEWHMASLERIFIENKIYQAIEGKKSREEAYEAVDERLAPFKKLLRREVTHEDVVKAYRAAVHPHLEIRLRQGRQPDKGHRGGDGACPPRPRTPDRLRRRLVRPDKGEVRQGTRTAHRTAGVRQHRGGESGRRQRQTLRGPRRGLFRHRQRHEEGRIRLRLFRHRRGNRLHPGRQLSGDEGERQGLLCPPASSTSGSSSATTNGRFTTSSTATARRAPS